MALFQSEGFDAYLAEGPPIMVQKITGYLVRHWQACGVIKVITKSLNQTEVNCMKLSDN